MKKETTNVPAAQVLPAATIQERYVTARERYEGVEAELTEFGETLPVGTALYADKPACARKPLDFNQMHKVTSEAHIAFCLGKFDSFEVALIRHTEKAHGVEESANAP